MKSRVGKGRNLLLRKAKIMVTNFLLKKRTNPTPYSPISNFGIENNPPTQPCAFIILYSNIKLLKTPNNLTTLKYP